MCNPMIAVAAITAASTIASSAITAKAQKKQNLQPQEVKNESITDQVAKTANTLDNSATKTNSQKQNITALNTKPFNSNNPVNSGAYIENNLGFDKLGLNIGG